MDILCRARFISGSVIDSREQDRRILFPVHGARTVGFSFHPVVDEFQSSVKGLFICVLWYILKINIEDIQTNKRLFAIAQIRIIKGKQDIQNIPEISPYFIFNSTNRQGCGQVENHFFPPRFPLYLPVYFVTLALTLGISASNCLPMNSPSFSSINIQ